PGSLSRFTRPTPQVQWLADGVRLPRFPGISGYRAAALRQPGGARVCEGARLLRRAVALRAEDLRARDRRGRARHRGLHARLLPARAGPLHRAHGDEAVAGDAEEPQAAEAAG